MGDVGLRILGSGAVVVSMGVPDVSEALRDRDDLPAVAAGAHPDEHARSVVAVVVRGHRLDPAQRVGVAALGGVVGEATRLSQDPTGTADFPGHVGLAPACGRGTPRLLRSALHRTPRPDVAYDQHAWRLPLGSTEPGSLNRRWTWSI